jgi:hypothetical protein
MAGYSIASNDGTSNNTTPVTIVAAPASGKRRLVKAVNIYQGDTVNATVEVRYVSSGGTRIISKMLLAPNDSLVLGEEDLYVLDSTAKSITFVLSGSVTTNQLQFVASWLEEDI